MEEPEAVRNWNRLSGRRQISAPSWLIGGGVPRGAKKQTGGLKALPFHFPLRQRLDGLNVLSLQALGSTNDVELNALCFLKAAEAVGVDRREVDEDVLVVAIAGDKTEALGVVEPLDNTLFHDWGVPLVLYSLEDIEEGVAASSAKSITCGVRPTRVRALT